MIPLTQGIQTVKFITTKYNNGCQRLGGKKDWRNIEGRRNGKIVFNRYGASDDEEVGVLW
jgi:hypothetical protein